MELNTYRQLAERLKELANQLVQNGDAVADSTVSAAVAALEHAAILSKHEFESPAKVNVTNENHHFGASKDLSVVVEEIQSTSFSGQPPSERFRDEIVQHDRTRCIASIAFEDLWNGFDGWKSPSVFWEMVIFVWRNASDFFEDYDPKREINEEPSRWTQRYFDEQRNFLRHNFCLRRLCHLVMVYEYLHGAETAVKKPSPVQPSCSNRSGHVEAPRSTKPDHVFLSRFAIIVCVSLTVVASIYLLGARSGGERPEAATMQPENVQIATEQSSPIMPSQAVPEIATNPLPEMSVRDEVRKHGTRSSEVVKSTIALQESAPQAQKAPIRRSGSVANKQ